MAKGVKKSDYAESASERAQAEVAKSEYARFKEKFAPLLVKRATESQTDALKTTLRGRANADTMQALSKPSIAVAESSNAAGSMADAVQGQLATANASAREYQNKVGANVLAKAQQQAGTSIEGLSQAARLSTSAALAKAQARQEVAQAKINALAQVGSQFVSTGAENYSQTGDFFTPGTLNVDKSNAAGKAVYDPAKTWQERLAIGFGRG